MTTRQQDNNLTAKKKKKELICWANQKRFEKKHGGE
jgi:hypothetical protein